MDIIEYLLNNTSINREKYISICKSSSKKKEDISSYRFAFDNKKSSFEEIFMGGTKEIPCWLYQMAITGEGNESTKIDSLVSSSLQALLFFSCSIAKDKVFFKGEYFENIYLEYKNPVCGYPSSIDVVLENKEKVIFIESKFYEIIRDSNIRGSKEIGPTYFSNDRSGYYKALKLNIGDLDRLGIKTPCSPDEYGKISNKALSERLKRDNAEKTNKKPTYTEINPINGNQYVYSYGIKQLLSHVIGIVNVTKGRNKSEEECNHEVSLAGKRICYYEIVNSFPGYCFEEAETKIANFKNHCNEVYALLREKGLGIEFGFTSYQELYNENMDTYRNLIPDNVAKYYHLVSE